MCLWTLAATPCAYTLTLTRVTFIVIFPICSLNPSTYIFPIYIFQHPTCALFQRYAVPSRATHNPCLRNSALLVRMYPPPSLHPTVPCTTCGSMAATMQRRAAATEASSPINEGEPPTAASHIGRAGSVYLECCKSRRSAGGPASVVIEAELFASSTHAVPGRVECGALSRCRGAVVAVLGAGGCCSLQALGHLLPDRGWRLRRPHNRGWRILRQR